MRTPGWSLATWLLLAPALLAQQQQPARPGGPPVQPDAPNPAPNELDTLLQQFSKQLRPLSSFQS